KADVRDRSDRGHRDEQPLDAVDRLLTAARPHDIERQVDRRSIQVSLWILRERRRRSAAKQSEKDGLEDILGIVAASSDAVRRAVHQLVMFQEQFLELAGQPDTCHAGNGCYWHALLKDENP